MLHGRILSSCSASASLFLTYYPHAINRCGCGVALGPYKAQSLVLCPSSRANTSHIRPTNPKPPPTYPSHASLQLCFSSSYSCLLYTSDAADDTPC
eukprot:214025-Pyramimonas_sp.AAC.2